MSSQTRKLVVAATLLTLLILVVAVISARNRSARKVKASVPPRVAAITVNKGDGPRARNLALQPEAFNMSRRLGRRFASEARGQSVAPGNLIIGSQRHIVQVVRSQKDDGELVEIKLGSGEKLGWDAGNGATSGNRRANGVERELIERIVSDSPDQFVLAQLRGASYYTVARNVRPVDAENNYNGPTWTVIRITDGEVDESKRPLSRWRLYYINTRTGLIDRVVSELHSEEVVAEFSWTEIGGEKVPSRVVWKRGGQVLMRFDLGGFSHAEQKGANR